MSLGDLLSLLLTILFFLFVAITVVERAREGTLVRDADGRFSVAASVLIIVAGLLAVGLVSLVIT